LRNTRRNRRQVSGTKLWGSNRRKRVSEFNAATLMLVGLASIGLLVVFILLVTRPARQLAVSTPAPPTTSRGDVRDETPSPVASAPVSQPPTPLPTATINIDMLAQQATECTVTRTEYARSRPSRQAAGRQINAGTSVRISNYRTPLRNEEGAWYEMVDGSRLAYLNRIGNEELLTCP